MKANLPTHKSYRASSFSVLSLIWSVVEGPLAVVMGITVYRCLLF